MIPSEGHETNLLRLTQFVPDRPARPLRPRRPARPTRRPNRLTRRPTRPTLATSPADFTSPTDTPRSLNNRRKRGLINGLGKIMYVLPLRDRDGIRNIPPDQQCPSD